MIRFEALTYKYPHGPELCFSDLSLPAGGTLLVRGPSGSGKSTLLALLAGLLTPSAGHVWIGGADVGAMAARQRDIWRGAQLGFVPQRLHLSEALTVADNLALPYVCAGETVQYERIEELMNRLELHGLAQRKPQHLSVGQAQRVALARALLRRPAVLLADEPTASLDDEAAAEVLDLIKELAASSGATLVLSTHDERVTRAVPGALSMQLSKVSA